MNYHHLHKALLATAALSLIADAYAQTPPSTIPGPADAARVRSPLEDAPPKRDEEQGIAVPAATTASAPEGADTIRFVLRRFEIQGATAFDAAELESLYAPHIGKEVSLSILWEVAAKVTERYHNAGYVLSRAYVPQQEIDDGAVFIRVVEGYVGEVELAGPAKDNRVVQQMIKGLTARHPLKADDLEKFLLQLNDLPGMAFRAILAQAQDKEASEGAVRLVLEMQEKRGRATATYDNFGSRFLGPNQAALSWSGSFVPMHQTSLYGMISAPWNEMKYTSLSHSVALTSDLALDIGAGRVLANPGYSLEVFDIQSKSDNASIGISYKPIRQRHRNLLLKLGLDAKNVSSEILGAPLTRDRIRAVRGSATYDTSELWQSYNVATFTLTQGLDGLGARKAGSLNLSRGEAQPDFRKAELSLSHSRYLVDNVMMVASAVGQAASGPVFSSEEFGYGGQSFGRAFDVSEITGDHGVAGALELRYTGVGEWQSITPTPYVFYDIGKIWNEDAGADESESGASAGLGIKMQLPYNLNANIGAAFPLTRPVSTPIGHNNRKNPRYFIQILAEY